HALAAVPVGSGTPTEVPVGLRASGYARPRGPRVLPVAGPVGTRTGRTALGSRPGGPRCGRTPFPGRGPGGQLPQAGHGRRRRPVPSVRGLSGERDQVP